MVDGPAFRPLRRPWGMATRVTMVVAGVVGLAALHVPRPPTLCLLRETTGIPCPLCGFTTAAVHLGHADLLGAARVSPLAVAVCVGFVLAPLANRSRMMTLWNGRSHRTRQVLPVVAVVPLLLLSEVWQLHRFGVI